MKDTVRKQKSGDQLAVGDWLAPGELHNLPTEVAWTNVYQVGGERHVQVLHRPMGETGKALGDVLSATGLFDLATEDELAGLRERAERARKIADIRALADWLEANPEIPMAYGVGGQADLSDSTSYSAAEIDAVRAFAEKHGGEFHKGKDHTSARIRFGGVTYSLIAWHKDGRPAESAPETKRGTTCEELEGAEHYEARGWKSGAPIGGCGVECACGVTYDGFDSIAEARGELTRHIEALAEPSTCPGRDMDCGRPLPCPDHPVTS